MQKLFYVTCRWLEEDSSRQSCRISDMIKQQMQQIGFNYQSISGTERQRQELYREREKLIREKQRLEQQKRQIQQQRQNNLRLIEEKEKLQRQREQMEQKLNRQKSQTQGLKEENQELEQKRKTMVEEYQRLQQQRDKIIEERQLLYERMEKIEKLQRLQRMYQQELRRLREEAQTQQQPFEDEKTHEQDSNQMPIQLPRNQGQIVTATNNQQLCQHHNNLNSVESTSRQETSATNNLGYPVQYSSGFSNVSSVPPRFTGPVTYSSWSTSPYQNSSRFMNSNDRKQQNENLNNQTQQKKDQQNSKKEEKQ